MSAPNTNKALRGRAWMIEYEFYDCWAMTDRFVTVHRVFRTKTSAERFVRENPKEFQGIKRKHIHLIRVEVE